jgi:hypothetical protein
MSKIILNVNGKFYELKSNGKAVEIEDPVGKTFADDICLYSNTTINNTKFDIYEDSVEDYIIEKNGVANIGNLSVITKIVRVDGYKVSFHMKRDDVENLFSMYSFSKIIPLDWVLYNFKAEIAGVITNSFNYIKQFKSVKSLIDGQPIISYDDSTEFLEHALLPEEYQNKSKAILSDIDVSDYSAMNLENISVKDIYKIIDTKSEFNIEDYISLNFQSKKYKKILLVFSLLLFIVTPYFLFNYISNKTYTAYYTGVIADSTKTNQDIDNKVKEYSKQIIYKEYNPFNVDSFMETTEKVAAYNGILSMTITVSKNGKKYSYDLLIDGVDNLEKITKELNIKGFNQKKGFDIFQIVYEKEIK